MSQSQIRMNKRQSVTIKEVAERAGVSLMTVSRVLNKQSVVKEETRARVEEAMRDLNYRPNMLARGLAGGNSIFIGLVHANPSGSYLSEFLVGALNKCRELTHHLVLEDMVIGEDTSVEEFERHLRNIGLDGMIVTPPLSENPAFIQALRNIAAPFVLVSPGDNAPEDASVIINDRQAAEMMTTYLIEKGHRRIGFILGKPDQSSTYRRHEGFLAAMKAHGLDIAADDVIQGAFTYRSGMQAAEKILGQATPPTAIFASNDDMAAGVIAMAHQRGLKIPQDLSVVGFDDTPIATAIWPQLTTIRQPIADMAQSAVTMLSESVAGTTGNGTGKPLPRYEHLVLDIAIVERDTVGAPKGA